MTMDVDGDGLSGVDASAAQQVSEAERFALLKGAVKESPTDYAAHLALVEYLRKERPGSLELSKARQGFSARFPLSPELWQEWIDDRRAAGGEDALEDVLGLYERAFADYQCAKLWPGYLETLEESLDEDDEGGVTTMREAFERALSRVGVHPILGGAVWGALLRFEKEELEDAQETGADAAEVSKAQDRVKRVYRRQLSVPLVGNDDLLEEAGEAFSGDDAGFKEACHAHAKASKMLAARMEHERVVTRCQENDPGGAGAANAWEAYAAMEAADGHPSRAVLVLERAESEGCCLHERIWITHSDLLLAQMGAKDLEEALTARAVRNLPWSAELWCRRLRSLERSSAPGNNTRTGATLGGAEEPVSESSAAAEREKEMRKVWKEALGSALPSPDEYVKVLLAYCSSFRRRLLREVEAAVKAKSTAPEAAAIGPAAAPGQQQGAGAGAGAAVAQEEENGGSGIVAALEAVRAAFDEAEAFVDKNYSGWDEGWLLVVRQRIQVEDEVVEDIADLGLDGVEVESQARQQWSRALRHSGKSFASWVEAVKWERGSTGDLAACRRLYARSFKEVQDFPEAAYTAYLNFEQEVGSLEDWDAANKEVFNSRAARGLLSRDLPLASRAWAGGAAAQPLHQPTQRQVKNKKQQQQQQQNDRGNSKRTGSNKRGAPPGAPHGPPSAGGGGEAAEGAPDSGTNRGGNKRARTSGAPPGATGGDVSAAAAAREPAGKRMKAGKGSREEEEEGAASGKEGSGTGGGGGGGVEGLTAFVNLPFTTADAGLKDMFKACGEVTGTRVLSDPKGRSEGLGYVTFADEEALLKALALDGTEIEGRVISVQRSLPRGARPAKGGGKGGAGASAAAAAAAATVMPAAPEPAAAAAAEAAAAEGKKERGGADGDGGEGGGGDAEHGPGDTKKKGKKKKKKKAEGGASGAGGGGVKWPAHPTTVFVRGLGMSATSKDLREAFVGAGPVLEARVVEDKKTGETKGYGLVQFEEAAAVEKALALDGTSMCGGTASITRSRHPAVVVAPAPAPDPTPASAPGVAAGTEQASDGAAAAGGSTRRPTDWDCPNPDCDQVCFSFRTVCNRCGTGKDGTPPSKDFRQVGGGGGQGAGADGQPVVATLHRPRLQLGAAIKPRALRNTRSTNGAGPKPAGTAAAAAGTAAGTNATAGSRSGGGTAGGGDAPNPAPSSKSNADFRAMLTKK